MHLANITPSIARRRVAARQPRIARLETLLADQAAAGLETRPVLEALAQLDAEVHVCQQALSDAGETTKPALAA